VIIGAVGAEPPRLRGQRRSDVPARLRSHPPARCLGRRRFAQAHSDGDVGLGTTWISALFLVTILAVVLYLGESRRDQAVVPHAKPLPRGGPPDSGPAPVGCADRWRRRLAVWTASRRSAAGRASPGR
jgi:hypothetical protein